MSPENFEKLKKRLLRERVLAIELISNSMAPVMPTGTIAQISPVVYEEIQPMDFIVFRFDEIIVCHAAWEAGFFRAPNGERTLITRGLINPFFDNPVRESEILGRVTSHSISRAKFYWLALSARLLARIGIRDPRARELSSNKLKNDVR